MCVWFVLLTRNDSIRIASIRIATIRFVRYKLLSLSLSLLLKKVGGLLDLVQVQISFGGDVGKINIRIP